MIYADDSCDDESAVVQEWLNVHVRATSGEDTELDYIFDQFEDDCNDQCLDNKDCVAYEKSGEGECASSSVVTPLNS